MARKQYIIFLATAALIACAGILSRAAFAATPPSESAEALPAGASIETVVSGLDQPVALAFDPAGRLFVTERSGKLRLIVNGALQPNPVIALKVDTYLARGLLGVALDPNFNTNHYIYVYYSQYSGNNGSVPGINKVARFVENNGVGSGLTELFSSPDVGTFPDNHIGGNIHFGLDGKLYITIGDDGVSTNAQDVTKKNGKIHRINPDGTIPADNPVFTPTGALPSLYTRGQRNSFDFAFDPLNGNFWASDNGPDCDDELNRIVAGGNYGWRTYPQSYHCDAANDEDNNPDLTYNTLPPAWWTAHDDCCDAPTGVEFYRGNLIPAWSNELFMCAFGGTKPGGKLRHMHLSADRRSVTSVGVVQDVSCNMDIETGKDGALYYIEGGGAGSGSIKRIVASAPTSTPTPTPPPAWPRHGLDLAYSGGGAVTNTLATGATAVRVYISWSAVEPANTTPEHFNWSVPDARIQPFAANGLDTDVVITDCPAWACPTGRGPLSIAPPAEFTQFAGALAARYRGKVRTWEFWNEPDAMAGSDSTLGWGGHGRLYADMLAAAVPTMRQQDPAATYAVGGLGFDWFPTDNPPGPFNHEFMADVLDRLKELNARAVIDYVPFHYYARNIHWPNVVAKTAELRQLVRSHGYNLPLVLNETGLTSSSDPAYNTPQWGVNNPEVQARFLVQTFAQAISAREPQLNDMTGLFWHTLTDYNGGGVYDSFAESGLFTISGQRKPAFYAYKAFKQEVGESDYVRRATAAEVGSAAVEAHIFEGASKPVWVLWSNVVTPTSVTFNQSQVVRVLDMCGQVLPVSGTNLCPQAEAPEVSRSGTQVTITATRNPVFVEFNCLARFTDAPCDFYGYQDIEYLASRGIVAGYADGTFRPFNFTTRGQLAKMVTLAEGWAIDSSGGPHFGDVPAANPFYSFIETAYHHGVINGYSRPEDCAGRGAPPCFRWELNITRGQTAKIIVLAEGWSINTGGGPHFVDTPPDNPFYTFVETAFNKGILNGYSLPEGGFEFRWYNDAVRGQLAKIIHLAVVASK